jgi:hypothetical protein
MSVTTIALFCRGPGEVAWSRLTTAVHGAESHELDRGRAEAAAERHILSCRENWARTLFPDHEFTIRRDGAWPEARSHGT